MSDQSPAYENWPQIACVAAIALVHVAAARFGLRYSVVDARVTLAWTEAPTLTVCGVATNPELIRFAV
jgi:hypothetical protein